MMKRGDYAQEVARLGKAIDAIARKCWRGLPALTGQAARPSQEQIADALNVAGVDADAAFILAEWSAIVGAVQAFSVEFADDWRLYLEFIRLKETGRSGWGMRGAATRCAEKFDVSRYDVYKIVRDVPRRIAALLNLT